MHENEIFASFWNHIDELRRTFLQIFLIIITTVMICFLFHEQLLLFLKEPLISSTIETEEERLEYLRIYNSGQSAKIVTLPENSFPSDDLSHHIRLIGVQTYQIDPQGSLIYARPAKSSELVLLGPLEGILTSLKASFWIGFFVSSPLWLYIFSKFLIPGLRRNERVLILPFMVLSLLFVALGCLFAYCFTIPIANQYLAVFNGKIGLNFWSLASYLDYTLFLLLANGIAFELGVIGIFAVHLQILSAEALISHRRFAILGFFILSALLTPPDVLTQFMLAIPLIGLYEVLIIYAKLNKKWTSRYIDIN